MVGGRTALKKREQGLGEYSMGGQTGPEFNDTRMKMPSGSPLLCELTKKEGSGGG